MMKHFAHIVVVLLIAVLPVQTALADDGSLPNNDPPDPSRIQIVTHQLQVVKAGKVLPGIPVPNGSSQQTVSGWTIEWANASGYTTGWFGSKYVRHEFARTRKVSGPSGSYQAEAHATLIDGPNYGGTQVFNYITHPCAQSIVNNGTAQSCSSPWQSSSTGRQWYIVSGHYFDIGINGSQDAACPGCIDWVYVTP
jgi:hypothetical protein